MSYKSMEAIMNVFNSREFYKPKKQYSKESIIYSNEVVEDFRKIAKVKTSREQLELSMELYNEFRLIDSVVRREFHDLYKRQEIAKGLHRFGKEAVRFYLSMEDGEAPTEAPEEGKAAPANPGKLAGLKEALKKAWQKFITMISSFIRWAQGIISSLIAKKDTIDPAKFDASKFTNMDAEINVPPVKESVLQDFAQLRTIVFSANDKFKNVATKDIKSVSTDDIKNAVADLTSKGDVNKFVNQTFYGTDEAPKKQKTTVGKFLNCTSGQKPALLEVCSKQYLETLTLCRKHMENSIKICNKVLKDASKNIKGDELKKIKELQWGMSMINNLNVKLFKNAISIRGYVSYAIQKGLNKKAEGSAKPAEGAQEQQPAENTNANQ